MTRSVKTFTRIALAAIGAPMLFGTTCATQTCPTGQQLVNGLCVTTPPPLSLTGLWSGPVAGNTTSNLVMTPTPPNPNPFSVSQAFPLTSTLQLEFDANGLPAALPVPTSGFGAGLPLRAVTAFTVGQTQTFTSSSTLDSPFGAAATEHDVTSEIVTLTVTESDLSQAHFKVVYTSTDVATTTRTSASLGTTCMNETSSSSGTFTVEATATTTDAISFSVVFSNSGTDSNTSGAPPCPPAASTTATQTATSSGTATGPLARM